MTCPLSQSGPGDCPLSHRGSKGRNMKFRYKVLIVLAVFIGALGFFGGGVRQTLFPTAASVTPMSESTLPTISIDVGGIELNRLHGYVSNLDGMIVRETITPITGERAFTVLIDENESVVKKLKYEIYNSDGREVESDSFTVLDVENGPKKVRIALKETMKSGKEYVAKITLITNQSKRIYYYTRLKMYDEGHLYEKLEFVQNFHNTLINGSVDEREKLKKYLESSRASDNTTHAFVNIKSSFSMVNWGDLNPVIVWEDLPTIIEFYESMATIELRYMVLIETDNGAEYYMVKEHFRIQYTAIRTYLYNYERTMEALFDVSNTSLSKDEFMLGITNDINAQTGASPSRKYLCFVYGRELLMYDVDANTLVKVFSFRQVDGDYARTYYDQHEVRLLQIRDNGDVDFIVCGYMNRGEYEGRVGIILYRYIHADQRIEEQLYIPVNSSYQLLKAEMSDFAYLGQQDVFYFSIYDAIYSYDLITRKLKVLADNLPSSGPVYVEAENYLAWQDSADDLQAKNIFVLDLTTGEIHPITTSAGEHIHLYGKINSNIIYGFSYEKDMWTKADGSRSLPVYKLCIEDGRGNILKTYGDSATYIDNIDIGPNIITLHRLKRSAADSSKYVETEDDTILNRLEELNRPVYLTKRVTDKILTEYYVSIPSGIDITEVPALKVAQNTVINYETTTRVSEPDNHAAKLYAYAFGDIVHADTSPATVVIAADKAVGTVLDSEGKLVWERGIKAARTEITGIKTFDAGVTYNSAQAAMKMVLAYKNLDIEPTDYSSSTSSIADWLDAAMKTTVLDLTGCTLDEVLYYVYKQRPVIAIEPDGNACVITGYDAVSVTVYEPARKKSARYQLKEAVNMFDEAGNIFISYTD